MPNLVFFYGTLMTPFNRTGRSGIDRELTCIGRGSISAALFDVGIYPAAVPASDAQVWGEVYEMHRPVHVLKVLDEIEGCRSGEPEAGLYRRMLTPVTLEDGRDVVAWAYFYNAPLGRAQRIESGDYLEYLNLRLRPA
jgi:gamma-glutamylcyclotransferase (GGCT)/AIG2-like uncharacterized protein YtfP